MAKLGGQLGVVEIGEPIRRVIVRPAPLEVRGTSLPGPRRCCQRRLRPCTLSRPRASERPRGEDFIAESSASERRTRAESWAHEASVAIGKATGKAAPEDPLGAATAYTLQAIYAELRHQADEREAHAAAMNRLAGWLDEHTTAMNTLATALEQQ